MSKTEHSNQVWNTTKTDLNNPTVEHHKLDLRKVLWNKVNNLLQSQATPIYWRAPQIVPKECWTARYYERDREREQFNGLVSRSLNNMLFVLLL